MFLFLFFYMKTFSFPALSLMPLQYLYISTVFLLSGRDNYAQCLGVTDQPKAARVFLPLLIWTRISEQASVTYSYPQHSVDLSSFKDELSYFIALLCLANLIYHILRLSQPAGTLVQPMAAGSPPHSSAAG